jgi:membrane-associated phospholipid phosphatase
MKVTAVALVVLLSAGTARAEKDYVPWYRGKYGNNRITHMAITASLGLVWLGGTVLFQDKLAATTCRWCDPPGFDRSARNTFVWNDVKRAGFLSDIDAYAIAPAIGLTLLYFSDKDASWSRLIDDILPVAETVAVSQVIVAGIKLATARARPYVAFDNPKYPAGSSEDNLSFPSGHSSLGFAITASAGLICHWRGYWTEPYVWGSGIALSLSTEYLRMAADRHWLSDVLVGGFVGIGSGLLIPRLMRRDIKITPVANGVAVLGQF